MTSWELFFHFDRSGVNWIGLYTKYLTERAQRKAFLETRRSLEMRFKTQKENERQERLLLSVLPSFVAQQMIRDIALEEERALGEFQPSQFHKIYIHRYEQVSILFADIKGFTGKKIESSHRKILLQNSMFLISFLNTKKVLSFCKFFSFQLYLQLVSRKSWCGSSTTFLLVSTNLLV